METLPEASIMEGSLRDCSHRTYPTPRSGTSAGACLRQTLLAISAMKRMKKFAQWWAGQILSSRMWQLQKDPERVRAELSDLLGVEVSWRFSTEVFWSQLVSKGCFVLHVLHFLRGLGRGCPQRQCLQHLEISKTICNSPKHLPHQPSLSFPISRVVSDEVTFQKLRWRFRTLA